MERPNQTVPDNTIPERFGYAGLDQPSRNIILQISSPKKIDFKSIDLWLEKLAIPVPNDLAKNTQQAHTVKETAFALISRVLIIATQLQHGNNIPVFAVGNIQSITADKKNSSVRVSIQSPSMDFFPIKAETIIFNGALKIVHWAIQNTLNSHNLQRLYKYIETSILKPLKQIIPGGKSTIPILQTAFELNIPFRHIGKNTYQLGWGTHAELVYLSSISKDSVIGVRLSENKAATARVLRAAGLPAPVHILVQTKEQAISAATKLGWPLVVKPNDLNRGEGISIDIQSETELVNAYQKASELSKDVLVEQQVDGVCYRFTVSNGNLIYAIKRNPISVRGDGKKTVAELISEANRIEQAKPPWARRKYYPSDELAHEAVSEAGFKLDAVPNHDELVPLRKIESTADGGSPIEVTHLVHPDNRQAAIQAARLFRLENAGVDIICDDISKSWHENGAIINEVNFQPALSSPIAKQHMPTLLAQLIQDDGRIPVDVIVGGEQALQFGKKLQQDQIAKGIRCSFASESLAFTNKEQPSHADLFNNVLAMLMDTDLESLVVVIQTDNFLDTGLPFDKVSNLYISPEPIKSTTDDGLDANKEKKDRLVSLIMNYTTQKPVFLDSGSSD